MTIPILNFNNAFFHMTEKDTTTNPLPYFYGRISPIISKPRKTGYTPQKTLSIFYSGINSARWERIR